VSGSTAVSERQNLPEGMNLRSTNSVVSSFLASRPPPHKNDRIGDTARMRK
jgi:hypothetical protein